LARRKWQRVRFIGNLDRLPENEDWIKRVRRDIGTDGKKIPTRFDREAAERGEWSVTLRERSGEE